MICPVCLEKTLRGILPFQCRHVTCLECGKKLGRYLAGLYSHFQPCPAGWSASRSVAMSGGGRWSLAHFHPLLRPAS